jgi:hypothetical protein
MVCTRADACALHHRYWYVFIKQHFQQRSGQYKHKRATHLPATTRYVARNSILFPTLDVHHCQDVDAPHLLCLQRGKACRVSTGAAVGSLHISFVHGELYHQYCSVDNVVTLETALQHSLPTCCFNTVDLLLAGSAPSPTLLQAPTLVVTRVLARAPAAGPARGLAMRSPCHARLSPLHLRPWQSTTALQLARHRRWLTRSKT